MEENTYQAQDEIIAANEAITVSPVTEETPKSLEEIIAGLRGFGIEENEEILTIVASGRTVKLRISNIPTEEEMQALLAAEGVKGYAWVQRIRAEIISRAISWIDGVSIRELQDVNRYVIDPTDKRGVKKDVQEVLRNVILGWGQELLGVLWKILMVHSDKIEKRLQAAFPDSTLMTDVEQRFMEAALKEIEESSKAVIQDTVEELFDEQIDEADKKDLEAKETK